MSNLSQINAMIVPKEPPQYASIPSQSMALARAPAVDDVAKLPIVNAVAADITTTSNVSARPGDAKVSNTELIAAATSNALVIRKDSRQTLAHPMTGGEVAKAARGVPWEDWFPRNYRKWMTQEGRGEDLLRYLKFDHSSKAPPKNRTASLEEHRKRISPYLALKEWPLWISEVKDDVVRRRLTTWILSEMEQLGFDPELYARPLLQHQASNGPVKRGNKKEKVDDTLLFDDMIETSTGLSSKNSKANYKITKKEFQETGASIDAVNLRIVTREVAAGDRLFEDYVQIVKNGRISVDDWKNRTDMTAANPHGRNLLVYALHEVQLAKDEINQLKKYLPLHKAATQKKNTNNRISECTARINHWLALAIELDNARSKDETEYNHESEAEGRTAGSPIPIRDDTPTPIGMGESTPSATGEINLGEFVTPRSSTTSQEDTTNRHEDVLPIDQKLKIPYGAVQDDSPVTPKIPPVQRVRLRPPKPPIDADGQQKHQTETKRPLPLVRETKRKRKVDSDSDEDFQIEEGVKPATKRTKTNDQASTESPKEQYALTPEKGIPAPIRSSSANNTTHSLRSLSKAELQSREIYLRKTFLPNVNTILKKAGIGHMRSVPNDWNVIKSKLKDAKVGPMRRNELLRDFKSGWVQTPTFQTDQSTATAPNNEQKNSTSFPAPSIANTDSSPRHELIVKLRAYEGFDPAEYSSNSIFMLPGFRYRYCAGSTIQDRIRWASIIEESVAATMRGEPPNGEWTRVYGQGKSVVNEWGKLIAEGCWDEFNGAAARKGAWLRDGVVEVEESE